MLRVLPSIYSSTIISGKSNTTNRIKNNISIKLIWKSLKLSSIYFPVSPFSGIKPKFHTGSDNIPNNIVNVSSLIVSPLFRERIPMDHLNDNKDKEEENKKEKRKEMDDNDDGLVKNESLPIATLSSSSSLSIETANKRQKIESNSNNNFQQNNSNRNSNNSNSNKNKNINNSNKQKQKQKQPGGKKKSNNKKLTNLDIIAETTYSLTDKFRTVKPYIFTFKTYAKERWYNRSIYDIMVKEFGAYPSKYYEDCIKHGRILINGEKKTCDYLIRNGDCIEHTTHRHEPPVMGGEISIVAETNDFFVVDKKPTMPCHPCGAYRHNSLNVILKHMRPDLKLMDCHRLDRLTSGVTIFAKTKERANSVAAEIRNNLTKKTYLARVIGDFRNIQDSFDKIDKDYLEEVLSSNDNNNKDRKDDDNSDKEMATDRSIKIKFPIEVVSYKDGIYRCHKNGKESETIVKFINYDAKANASIVECKPTTGRTHQIRLHLQYCGFPISNDPNYGDILQDDINDILKCDNNNNNNVYKKVIDDNQQSFAGENRQTESPFIAIERIEGETDTVYYQRTCKWCIDGDSKAFKDVHLHHKGIYLHALMYEGIDWKFTTDTPKWALDDFQEE